MLSFLVYKIDTISACFRFTFKFDIYILSANENFRSWESWYKNNNCQFAALIGMKRLRIFTHLYAASFTIKTCFMKLATLLISSTRKKLLAETLIKQRLGHIGNPIFLLQQFFCILIF